MTEQDRLAGIREYVSLHGKPERHATIFDDMAFLLAKLAEADQENAELRQELADSISRCEECQGAGFWEEPDLNKEPIGEINGRAVYPMKREQCRYCQGARELISRPSPPADAGKPQ